MTKRDVRRCSDDDDDVPSMSFDIPGTCNSGNDAPGDGEEM